MNAKIQIIEDYLYNGLDDIPIRAYAKEVKYDPTHKIFFVKCHDADILLDDINYFLENNIDIQANDGDFIISPSIKEFCEDVAYRFDTTKEEVIEILKKQEDQGLLIDLLDKICKELKKGAKNDI